jgi:hypothetical protein
MKIFSTPHTFLPLLLTAALLLPQRDVRGAAITLDVLQRDGFGVVDIKRPEPNMLTVIAEINGRKARLVVDTVGRATALALTELSLASAICRASMSANSAGARVGRIWAPSSAWSRIA